MMPIDSYNNKIICDYNLKQRQKNFLFGEIGYNWVRNMFLSMKKQEDLYENF